MKNIIKAINAYRDATQNIFDSKVFMQDFDYIAKVEALREEALHGSRKAARRLIKMLKSI